MSSDKILFVVQRGKIVPADDLANARLRAKGFRIGDQINAVLTKPRNPAFHRLAHAFGQLIADNIESFEGMDCHRVLKRLQYETGIGCEEMGARVPGIGFVPVRIPQSLSFSSMDEGRFREVLQGLARHVASEYWHGEVDANEVIQMAQELGQAA